jgi:hypothetical protein
MTATASERLTVERGPYTPERSRVLSVDRCPTGTGRQEWDRFVAHHPDATHCHRFGWQDVMSQVFAHECQYFVARGAGGAVEGVMPMVTVRSALFGHFVVSMPFLNYGGPIGSPRAVTALAQMAAAHAASTGAGLL